MHHICHKAVEWRDFWAMCVFGFFWKVTLTHRYIAAFIDPAIKQLHCFFLLFSTLKYDFFSPLTACFLLRLHLSTFIFYYAHTERRKSDGDEGKHWTEGGKQTDRVDRQIAPAVCVKLILTCPNSLPSSSPSLCLSYKLLSVCLHRLKRCCWDRLLAIRASANLSFIEIVLILSAKQGSHNAWWKKWGGIQLKFSRFWSISRVHVSELPCLLTVLPACF